MESTNTITSSLDTFTAQLNDLSLSHEALRDGIAQLDLDLIQENKKLAINLDEVGRLQKLLDSILRSIKDGVVAIDLSGKIVAANDAACRLIGLRKNDIVGKQYVDLFNSCTTTRLHTGWSWRLRVTCLPVMTAVTWYWVRRCSSRIIN
jgi:PAS domain-containing protein